MPPLVIVGDSSPVTAEDQPLGGVPRRAGAHSAGREGAGLPQLESESHGSWDCGAESATRAS